MTRLALQNASREIIQVIGQCLCLAAERTGKEFGNLEAQEWCSTFADCDPVELRQAFDNCTLNSHFAPSMAAIHQELQRLRFGGVTGAWLMVQQAAAESRCRDFFVVFEHPGIHFSIEAVGGWFKVAREIRKIERAHFTRLEFITAFENYRPTMPHPAGLGTFTGKNAVLIGHRERALRVYRTGVKRDEGLFAGVEILRPQVELNSWERPVDWPDQLKPENMAAPPGPPLHKSLPWMEE
jgi:hypothetical protein